MADGTTWASVSVRAELLLGSFVGADVGGGGQEGIHRLCPDHAASGRRHGAARPRRNHGGRIRAAAVAAPGLPNARTAAMTAAVC